MFGTGCRIGEIIGLRWEDVDFDNRMITIDHNITYYPRSDKSYKSEFRLSLPKTAAGIRTVPMIDEVYEALLDEEHCQDEGGMFCTTEVEGMSGFIFCNRFGNLHNPAGINRAIKRHVEDCNAKEVISAKREKREPVILPWFSCHIARHTFCSPPTKFRGTNTENTEETTEENTHHIVPSGERDDVMDEIDEIRQFIKSNMEYETLIIDHSMEKREIDELVELIVETIAVKQEYIRINKQDFPYAVVRSRFEEIHFDTMEYVLECMRNNTTKVRNIRSYMLTTLYNAPATCNNYYKAEVNHDMYNMYDS